MPRGTSFLLFNMDKKHQKTVIIQILQKICEIISLFQMKFQVFSGTCPVPMISMKLGTVVLWYYPNFFFFLNYPQMSLFSKTCAFPTELEVLGKSLAQSVQWVKGRQKIETDWFGRGCENDYVI